MRIAPQDKPVFVYKLIIAGSIEEKFSPCRERKAELQAAGILSEDRNVSLKFGEDDIAALRAATGLTRDCVGRYGVNYARDDVEIFFSVPGALGN